MARQKKEIHKVEMTDGKRAIIQQLFQEYNIESATDIQDALKDLLGGTIKQMMETEIDEHLATASLSAPIVRMPATATKPSASTWQTHKIHRQPKTLNFIPQIYPWFGCLNHHTN